MILVLDDENYLKNIVQKAFPDEEVIQYYDSLNFLNAIHDKNPDALIIDLRILPKPDIPSHHYFGHNPSLEGMRVLEKVRKSGIQTPAVLVTRFAVSDIFMRVYALDAVPLEVTDISGAVKSLKEKIGYYLEKQSRNSLRSAYLRCGFVVGDPHTLSLLKMVEKLKDSEDAILITGETGVGKDTLAHAIHLRSRRAKKPFMNFIISAYPQNLLFAKLFGTARNAYTGAKDHPGSFEEVGEGTLVLNEIGDLDLDSQIQLLQILETRTFSRLGEHDKKEFKGRIIAVTNRGLPKLIETGKFREDLYNRLRKFHIHIPPLRERREDISAFIKYYLPQVQFSPAAAHFLIHEFHYPGNLRTLRFILDRVKNLSPTFPQVSLDDIIASILDLKQFRNEQSNHTRNLLNASAILDFLLEKNISLHDFQNSLFNEALQRFGRQWTAETWGKLGISRATFYRKLKELPNETRKIV